MTFKVKQVLVLVAMVGMMILGFSIGQERARQACIDAVAENCEYICGVGSDFYYPDQEARESDPDSEPVNDTAIAFNQGW